MSGERGRLTVGIVFGGASPEHEVSVRSARSVLAFLDRDRFTPLPLAVSRQGVWLPPSESAAVLQAMDEGAPEAAAGGEAAGGGLLARRDALAALTQCAVVFPLIHGPGGEDGRLQGLLELAERPYVGAGVAASAIGMDKDLMKSLFVRAGLPVTQYRLVTAEGWRAAPTTSARTLDELGYPLFVKPANGGSSLGIEKVHSRETLDHAICGALRYDRRVLVEPAIAGREIECAVLGNAQPEASPLGEVRPHREFYDYAAKYEDPATELIVPADLPVPLGDRIREMAVAAFQAIDGAGMARVDFFLEADHTVWVNEINTIPGFTSVSMFPRLWEAAGLTYPELITRLLGLAIERHEGRRHGP